MDRASALPDRCVACNQPAGGYRMRRKLYSSPFLWRLGAFFAPFIVLYIGIFTNSELLIGAFWPLAIVLAIAHLFIRRSHRVEFGICARHRRLRLVLMTLSVAGMAGVMVGVFGFGAVPGALLILLGSLIALLVLMAYQSRVGVQALGLHSLSKEHAWLSGTGEPFRSELPELN